MLETMANTIIQRIKSTAIKHFKAGSVLIWYEKGS